jgi:hypothetical protein
LIDFSSSFSSLASLVHTIHRLAFAQFRLVPSSALYRCIHLSTLVIARTFVTLSRELVTLQSLSRHPSWRHLATADKMWVSLFLEVTMLRGLEPLHCFYT